MIWASEIDIGPVGLRDKKMEKLISFCLYKLYYPTVFNISISKNVFLISDSVFSLQKRA